MAGKFELKKTDSGKFMFNLKASNGRIILTSETYNSHDAAMNGIESVKKNAAVAGRFERKMTTANQPYFMLQAGNGECIGKSESYSSERAMEDGIASVMKNTPTAAVVDLTK